MKKSSFRFLNSSALVPTGVLSRGNVARPLTDFRAATAIVSEVRMEGSPVGVELIHKHRCPPMSNADLRGISREEPEFVTRHIEACYLDAALKGYFRIGTLARYRASEDLASGRLSDREESRRQDAFRSRTDCIRSSQVGQAHFSRLEFKNVERHLVLETVVNDFCVCASIGTFDRERGSIISEMEGDPDKKPGAFVTYNLSKLKAAVRMWLDKARPEFLTFEFVGRAVQYGKKDRAWEVDENFRHRYEKDAMAIWLGIAFVKPQIFSHEEEYRLLLVDPKMAGGLGSGAETVIIDSDNEIAAAIAEYGYY